jgi:hypothetical protein
MKKATAELKTEVLARRSPLTCPKSGRWSPLESWPTSVT